MLIFASGMQILGGSPIRTESAVTEFDIKSSELYLATPRNRSAVEELVRGCFTMVLHGLGIAR